MAPTDAPLTAAAIESGEICEDQRHEFKREVDFDNSLTKRDFIDDVVGFLNAEGGHLLIGVAEKKGRFSAFHPTVLDEDKVRRRITSVIQDSVVPMPTRIAVAFIAVDGGAVIDVVLTQNRMRPYQNRLNGAFCLRTGAQNRPLARDAVHAMFTPIETMEADAGGLMAREESLLEARDVMQVNGPSLNVAVIPGEHYDRGTPPFDPGHQGILKMFPHFHGGAGIFKGCDGGVEVRDASFDEGRATSRFFIADDWGMHSCATHPFTVDGAGRLTLHEFRQALGRHMNAMKVIVDDAGVHGPFCVLMAVRHLRRGDKLKHAFPNASNVAMPRGMMVERIDDPAPADRLYDLVRRGSIYG